MTVIFVDIHWNLTENKARETSAHWLQWEQNLLIYLQMVEFTELPTVWIAVFSGVMDFTAFEACNYSVRSHTLIELISIFEVNFLKTAQWCFSKCFIQWQKYLSLQ